MRYHDRGEGRGCQALGEKSVHLPQPLEGPWQGEGGGRGLPGDRKGKTSELQKKSMKFLSQWSEGLVMVGLDGQLHLFL